MRTRKEREERVRVAVAEFNQTGLLNGFPVWMALPELEEKLLRSALCPGAKPGEYASAAIKMVEAMRRRGARAEEFTNPARQGDESPTISRAQAANTMLDFGKHRGCRLAEVPRDYVVWIERKCYSRPELRQAAHVYLYGEAA